MVKAFIDINNPVGPALGQVMSLFDGLSFVGSADEAELIVVESARDVASTYRTDAWYAILGLKDDGAQHAANVRFIPVCNFLPGLLAYLEEIDRSVVAEKRPSEVSETVSDIAEDAITVLVIEDTPRHQASARKLLAGCRLTVAANYDEAMELMDKNRYEAVLSDLYLPMSPRTLSEKAFELGRLVPYGLLLALEASRRGAKYVAVATDLNHHNDPIAAAFDHYAAYLFQVNGAMVRFMHAPTTELEGEPVKDWRGILERAIGE